jgi:hypothetical protein
MDGSPHSTCRSHRRFWQQLQSRCSPGGNIPAAATTAASPATARDRRLVPGGRSTNGTDTMTPIRRELTVPLMRDLSPVTDTHRRGMEAIAQPAEDECARKAAETDPARNTSVTARTDRPSHPPAIRCITHSCSPRCRPASTHSWPTRSAGHTSAERASDVGAACRRAGAYPARRHR